MYVVARTDSIHSILSLSPSLPLSSDTSTNLSLSFFFPLLLSNGGGKQSPAGKRIEKREKSFFSASLSPSFFSCHAASPRPGKNSVMGAPPHHLTQHRVCVLYDGNISEHTGLHRTIQHRGKREEGTEGPVLLLPPPPPIIPPFLPSSVRPPTAMLNMQAYIHRPRTARVKGGGGGGGESCFSVLLLLRRGEACALPKNTSSYSFSIPRARGRRSPLLTGGTGCPKVQLYPFSNLGSCLLF